MSTPRKQVMLFINTTNHPTQFVHGGFDNAA
jgi:hypothetical protein